MCKREEVKMIVKYAKRDGAVAGAFFFNDTATTEVYTFPARLSSDLLTIIALTGNNDARATLGSRLVQGQD